MAAIFGLFLVALRITLTLQATEKSCVGAAICQLVRGDVHAALGLKTDKMHKLAREEMAQFRKFEVCKIDKINENCDKRKKACQGEMVQEATSNGLAKKMGMDSTTAGLSLLDKCDPKTWHYMFFLCDMKKWPKDVTALIPPDYPLCKQSCMAIEEFNTYHTGKGKTKADFPEDWEGLMANVSEDGFKARMIKFEKRNIERTIYTYLEYDSDAVGTEDPISVCPENTWLSDEPGDQLYWADYSPTRFKCVDSPTPSAQRGFLISAQFRRERTTRKVGTKDVAFDALMDGRYMYGNGEETFVDKDNKPFVTLKFGGWGTPMACPYTTAVCSIQNTRYYIPGASPVPTNIKIGCCVVPQEKLWLATAYVGVRYMRPGNFFLDDDIKARVGIFQYQADGRIDREKIYLCPAGQFIDKFQSTIVRAKGHTAEYAYTLGFVRQFKTINILQTDFYCNTRDKSFPSRILSEKLNSERVFEEYKSFANLGTYNCPDGFFTSVRLDIDTSNKKTWGSYMHCSADKPGEWQGGEWDYPGYPYTDTNYVTEYKGGEGTARCPQGYALCGVGATPFKGTFKPRDRRPEIPNTDLSLEGYFYRYLCCKVGITDRCDNPKFSIPRVVNRCPTHHVSQKTGCWVDFTSGTSYTETNTASRDRTNKVDSSFGITVPIKVPYIVDIATNYAQSMSNSRGFTFSSAEARGVTTGEALGLRYEIAAGSKLITAQPQISCGSYLLYANQTIDYGTPSIACIPKDSYEERVVPIDDQPKPWGGQFNLTVKGHGLELVGYLFPHPGLNVSWGELTEFLKDAFVRNSELQSNRFTDMDWRKTEPELWTKYDPSYRAFVTFDVPKDFNPKFYQIVAMCGDNWIVRTKVIRMLNGQGTGVSGAVRPEDRINLVKPLAYYEEVNGVIKSITKIN